jgi:hypothetical protein
VIDHVEALRALGIVHPADVDQHLEQAQAVVMQGLEDRGDTIARDLHGEFAARDLPTLDGRAELGLDMLGKVFQCACHPCTLA